METQRTLGNIILGLLFVRKGTSFSNEQSSLSETPLRTFSTIHIILCELTVKKYMNFKDGDAEDAREHNIGIIICSQGHFV